MALTYMWFLLTAVPKKEQKILQEEMKKYRDHPEKMAELSKKQFAFFPKTMKLTSSFLWMEMSLVITRNT